MMLHARLYTLMDRYLAEVSVTRSLDAPEAEEELLVRNYGSRQCNHVTCALQHLMEALDIAQGRESEREDLVKEHTPPQTPDESHR